MTYRISNQAGQLVTIALPVLIIVVTLLAVAFHGTWHSAVEEQDRHAHSVTSIEQAYLGLNP